MEPINFPESNTKLVADECGDLPAHKHADGYVTCWQLSGNEMFKVLQTGVVWLHVLSQQHPPIMMVAEGPFEKEIDDDDEEGTEDGGG